MSVCLCSDERMSVCVRSYDEDVVIMIARLQMLFYFFNYGEYDVNKMSRLAFMVLHKLAILAQQVRVMHVGHWFRLFWVGILHAVMFSTFFTSRMNYYYIRLTAFSGQPG